MSGHRWQLSDVKLEDRFVEKDDPTYVYSVIGIITEPVVILVSEHHDSVDTTDDQSYYVIGSPQFAEFRKVTLLAPGEGTADELRDSLARPPE